MSSGGMDWAYRMIGQHGLDPLGVAVVLHLGWRDAANQRTDRGIASALGQHRSSICKATAKLAALGLIVRRSGQWVAAETVAIVEQQKGARRPDPAMSDDAGPLSGPDHSVVRGGPLSGPLKDHSVVPKRKENMRKAAARSARLPAPPHGGGLAGLLPSLSRFQRSQVLAGHTVLVGSVQIKAGSPEMERLGLLLRSQERA